MAPEIYIEQMQKTFSGKPAADTERSFRCLANLRSYRPQERITYPIFPSEFQNGARFSVFWYAQSYIGGASIRSRRSEIGSGTSQKMCQTPGSNSELTTLMYLSPLKSSGSFMAKTCCWENSSTYPTPTARRKHSPWLKSKGFRNRL
jgi:hypothetical protein